MKGDEDILHDVFCFLPSEGSDLPKHKLAHNGRDCMKQCRISGPIAVLSRPHELCEAPIMSKP
ncbi:hypothetical protein, partial [Klebsiella pneumoniae]|uniref:hypothetical protein n=1 Tax=Klebsiella pneumoniae TaxID=573 RepID=UPI001EF89A11